MNLQATVKTSNNEWVFEIIPGLTDMSDIRAKVFNRVGAGVEFTATCPTIGLFLKSKTY